MRALLRCHARCATEAVVAALGIRMANLMPTTPNQPARAVCRRIVKAYDYRDQRGDLLFQVVRMEPKTFRQRVPKAGGGWSWSVKDVRRVLYRLHELVAADSAKVVFIPEGEKDVDRLVSLGFLATCNPGGAGKWKGHYCEFLRDRPIVILPDNDVSDWLDAGGTRERLIDLVKVPQAPLFAMPPRPDVAQMFRADVADARSAWLKAAKSDPEEYARRVQSDFLEGKNHEGEVLDFHSLRHTCGAWLAMAGAHPKAVQSVMPHSTITLTMDTYGHLFPGQDAATVARFPRMVASEPAALRATGTEGAANGPFPQRVDGSGRQTPGRRELGWRPRRRRSSVSD